MTDTEYTIVLQDDRVLDCLCGNNDKNIRLIEESLGVPVFARGNEISIEVRESDIREKFRFIIDRISDEVNAGSKDSQDIVLSVLNTKKKSSMEETVIVVPGAVRRIYPRTQNQAEYINLLQTKDMVFCSGSAGSGKTFLAVAQALSLVLSHKKNKIIITRPVVEAGESLGFLPGDLEEKTDPYLRPLRDAMDFIISPENTRRLFDSGIVEVAPLAYMRGRTLSNCVIILDEAQNTTCSQMKMFLTRMGDNSKVFITGDVTQIDLPKKIRSGLVHSMEVLRNLDDIGFMKLTSEDVVRNPLVKKIVKAYEYEESKQNV